MLTPIGVIWLSILSVIISINESVIIMNIFLNNEIINNTSLSDVEICVYIALRNIYLSNRETQYVSYNMLAYELFGNGNYKRATSENIKSAVGRLIEKRYITVIEKLSTTEFILDMKNLYIDMNKSDTYYTVIYDQEVHTIMNIETKADKFKMLRYFTMCMRTICRTVGVYQDMFECKQNFVGFMTQEYLCDQIGVSYESNAKLIRQYNSILEENQLLYIHRHTEMKRDKKTGQIKSFVNHYGRYSDKDDIDLFAANYEKACGINEEIVQSTSSNHKRSVSAKYNNLCYDFSRYSKQYSKEELIEIYKQIHHDNGLIEKEIEELNVKETSEYYDRLVSRIRDEDIFKNIPCVVEYINGDWSEAAM